MLTVVRVWALSLCLSCAANAQVRTLAVHPGSIRGLDGMVADALKQELQRLFMPAGIVVDWRSTGVPVVVGSLSGSCSTQQLWALPPSSSKTKILGEAIVTSEDEIVPFFRIDCDRVIRLLNPVLGPLSPPLRRTILGRALARVAAHEIYHIVTQSLKHESTGAAKAYYLVEDLSSSHFEFDAASLARLKGTAPSTVSVVHLPELPLLQPE